MFGTFVKEDEEPDYGTLVPVQTWDPVRANLQPWRDLWRKAAALPTWSERLLVWWRPPEWLPGGAAYPFPTDAELRTRPSYDKDAPKWRAWMAVHWVGMAAAVVWLLLVAETVPFWQRAVVAGMVAWTLASFGAILDGRAGATRWEAARVGGGVGVGVALLRG